MGKRMFHFLFDSGPQDASFLSTLSPLGDNLRLLLDCVSQCPLPRPQKYKTNFACFPRFFPSRFSTSLPGPFFPAVNAARRQSALLAGPSGASVRSAQPAFARQGTVRAHRRNGVRAYVSPPNDKPTQEAPEAIPAASAAASPAAVVAPSASPAEVSGLNQRAISAYGAMLAFFAAWGFALLVVPTWVVESTWQACPTEALTSALRMCGATSLTVLATINRLKAAGEGDRLGSDTYRRLNLGVIGFALCGIVAELACRAINPPGHMFPGIFLLSVVAVLAARIVSQSSQKPVAALVAADALALVTPGKTSAEWGYWAVALGTLCLAAAKMLAPDVMARELFSSAVGILGRHYLQMAGAATLVSLAAALALKDAAHRGRLAASTFRALNVGLTSTAILQLALVVHSLIIGVGSLTPVTMSMIGYLVFTAVHCVHCFATVTKQ